MKPKDLQLIDDSVSRAPGVYARFQAKGTVHLSEDALKQWPKGCPYAVCRWSDGLKELWLEPVAKAERGCRTLTRSNKASHNKGRLSLCHFASRLGIAKGSYPAKWEEGWLCIDLGPAKSPAMQRVLGGLVEDGRPPTRQAPTEESRIQLRIGPVRTEPKRESTNPRASPGGKCQDCYWHSSHINPLSNEAVWTCCNARSPHAYQVTGMGESCPMFERKPGTVDHTRTKAPGTIKNTVAHHMAGVPYTTCPSCLRRVMIVNKKGTKLYRTHVASKGVNCPMSGKAI